MAFQIGDRVVLTRAAKRRMQFQRIQFGNGTVGGWAMRAHAQEFRRCIGVVIEVELGAEFVGIRWEPSGLKYMYAFHELRHALPWEKGKRADGQRPPH